MRRAMHRCAMGGWLAIVGGASGALGGVSIDIANPGFEAPEMPLCGFGATVDWTAVGSAGTWRPGLGQECAPFAGYPGGVPEGTQTGWVNAGFLAQVLAATLEPDTHYTLSVEVGQRTDCCQFESYRVQLLAGGVLLAEDPGLLQPALGQFATSFVCFTTGPAHSQLGQPLEIRLVLDGGVQVDFDDVHLETSSPGTACGATAIPGDLDGDGDVDGADLGAMLGAWGPCADCADCPADLNGDCIVGGADLGLLLSNWS